MKRLFLALLVPVCAFAQNGGYTIKGNITGLKDSTMVFVLNNAGNTIAQTYASKGSFTLSGTVENDDIYQVGFIGYTDTYELFLANENIILNGKATGLKALNVTGSASAQDFALYSKRFNPLKEKLNTSVGLANQTTDGKKRDSLVAVVNKVVADLQTQIELFIKEKPSSPVSSLILYITNQLNGDVSVLERRYSQLSPAAKNNLYAKAIEQMLENNRFGSIGSMAPNFVQNDPDDKPVSLESFRGKYVLIDFWASWCRPCRIENPNVVAAYNAFKDKNFTILGVSLDQDKKKWVDAIKADNLTWTNVSDLASWSNAVAQKYKVNSIPQNFLIGPDGKIVAKNLRGQELHNTLSSVLK